jgi:23S rRNA-/tRNA-specific pseudouridylate synthase
MDDKVRKVYFARVKGNFKTVCKQELKNGQEKFFTEVDKSVYQVSFIENTWACASPDELPFEQKELAKNAQTRFRFISYCDKLDHSIVKCYPKTGRTH